jgi:hypothetical protein
MSLRIRCLLPLLVALLYSVEPAAVGSLQQTPELKSTDGVIVTGFFDDTPVSLLLDTGTTRSFIDVSVAKSAKAKLQNTFTLGGYGAGYQDAGVLSQSVRIDFKFESGTLEHRIQNVADYRRLSSLRGRDIHGILGADFFDRFIVEIDYGGERVLLHPRNFKPDPSAVTLRMTTLTSRTPVVDMRMHLPDGKVIKARTIVDTGNGGEPLAAEWFAKRHRLAEVLDGVRWPMGEGVGGKIFGSYARVPVLEFGSIQLSNSVVGLLGAGSEPPRTPQQYDLNVGNTVLSRFTAFLDYGRSRLTLVPNARINEPFDAIKSGLQLITLGSPHDRVVVEGVVADSPAALAGFEAGDEILEVNGERLGPLALVDLRARLKQPPGTEIKITARRRNMRGVLTLVVQKLVLPRP